jgi:hypothetical protein
MYGMVGRRGATVFQRPQAQTSDMLVGFSLRYCDNPLACMDALNE